MKKVQFALIFTIFSTLFYSASNSNHNIILTGNITNLGSDTLYILDNNYEKIHHILLDKENTFNSTFRINEGYYYLDIDNNYIKIFLKPGFKINLILNANKPYKSIKFKGIGASENEYLLKKYFLEKNFGNKEKYTHYAKLNEKDFLTLIDSIYDQKKILFLNQSSFDKDFDFIELNDIEFEKQFRIANYEDYHSFVTGNMSFKVSSSFPNVLANLELSNEKLLISINYHLVLEKYLLNETYKKIKKDKSQDFVFTLLETIDENITNKNIKEEFAYYFLTFYLKKTNRIDDVFNKFNSLVENKKYKKEISEKYYRYKKISKGAVSPSFEFLDINDNLVSLESLKGSYVYIDIWGTWCLPCIKAMPQFEILKDEFKNKNIKFVSICKNDTKERWKKMIEEKKLKPIQLFASDNNSTFFKDYLVKGVPRYILIDKEGKIIDANAKRPSNPKLKKLLKYLL